MLRFVLNVFLYFFLPRTILVIENASLRQQLTIYKRQIKKPMINPSEKLFWVFLSRFWKSWKKVLFIVQPETVIKWHRDVSKYIWKLISRYKGEKGGRPSITPELIALIEKMANENPIWGASRIHGELLKLGFSVSERTVARYMPIRDLDRIRRQSWKTFLKNQSEFILAMDFFTVFTLGFRQLYVLVIMNHHRRKILSVNATYNPTTDWIIQQFCNALAGEHDYRYLVMDNDKKFSTEIDDLIFRYFNLKTVRISKGSPWQNGICERIVRTFRRELLDFVIPFGPRHVTHILNSYAEYYNDHRPHRSLQKESPVKPTPVLRNSKYSKLITGIKVGGLHHSYSWAA